VLSTSTAGAGRGGAAEKGSSAADREQRWDVVDANICQTISPIWVGGCAICTDHLRRRARALQRRLGVEKKVRRYIIRSASLAALIYHRASTISGLITLFIKLRLSVRLKLFKLRCTAETALSDRCASEMPTPRCRCLR
jgi:hypothetical protein